MKTLLVIALFLSLQAHGKAPGAPDQLLAKALNSTSIRLDWQQHSDNENGFHIYRQIGDSQIFSNIGNVPANVVTFTDDTLQPNTTAQYQVTAYNDIGETEPTNSVTIATPQATYQVSGKVVDLDFNPLRDVTISLFSDGQGQRYSSSPNQSINDKQTITETLNVTNDLQISSIEVTIRLVHDYIGDLMITLEHPDGSRVILHNKQGERRTSINTTYPVQTAPVGNLSNLFGKQAKGNWKILVEDTAPRDEGNLDFIEIKLQGQGDDTHMETTLTSKHGVYLFPNINGGTYVIRPSMNSCTFTPSEIKADVGGNTGRLHFRADCSK